MNRAMPAQVLSVAHNTKGTTSHAPETESWKVNLLASEIDLQSPSTQWQTPTSIHFWKAREWGRGSATLKRYPRLPLSGNTGWKMWPSSPGQLLTIPHFAERNGASPTHVPGFVRGAQ